MSGTVASGVDDGSKEHINGSGEQTKDDTGGSKAVRRGDDGHLKLLECSEVGMTGSCQRRPVRRHEMDVKEFGSRYATAV